MLSQVLMNSHSHRDSLSLTFSGVLFAGRIFLEAASELVSVWRINNFSLAKFCNGDETSFRQGVPFSPETGIHRGPESINYYYLHEYKFNFKNF